MKALTIIITTLCSLPLICSAGYEGCYRETNRDRQFAISPGAYNPNLMTQAYCRSKCGAYSWQFSAVAHGKFCFCGNSLPALRELDSDCSMTCAGAAGEKCGSATHIGVFTSLFPITGLQVSSDVTSVQAVPATVTLSFGLDTGSSVAFQVDYGDGAGYTGANETGFESRELHMPGKHFIRVSANNELGTLDPLYTAVGVELTEPPGDVEVTCDPVMATFEEGQCEVTVWGGSHLSMDVSITSKPIADITALPVAGPIQEAIGHWTAASTGVVYPGPNAVYLLQGALFPGVGRVYSLLAHVAAAGTINLLILSPVCANTYCYESNSCKVSCLNAAAGTLNYQCAGGDSGFCAGKTSCDPSCASPAARFGTTSVLSDQYRVKSVTPLALPGTGSQTLTPSAPLAVEAGDIMGIEYTSALGGQLTLVTTSTTPDILMSPYTAASVGTQYARGSGSSTGTRHALQAFYTSGSKSVLKYTLANPAGTFPITATVRNTVLGSSASGASSVVLLEGVDYAIIESPEYAVKDQAVTIRLLPHTGSTLTYEWNVTDGSPTVSTQDLTHTFTAVGEYNISVAIYNVISRKENITTVIVLEEISGLSTSASMLSMMNSPLTITVNMATGTDVTCEVDYGDGTALETVSTAVAVTPSFDLSHTYTTQGTFSVSLNCSNQISNLQLSNTTVYIAEPMTNLRLERTGAPVGEQFALVWRLDSGSVDTHAVVFDGVSYPIDPGASSDGLFRWSTAVMGPLPAGGYPYTVTTTNALGSETINGTFKVMVAIVNPQLTADLNNVTTDDVVTFQVDMASGSDVTISVDYQDGSPNDVFPPPTPGAAWSGPMTFTHQFISGCQCSVRVTYANAAESLTRSVNVVARVGFSQIDWSFANAEEFYLFEPPAYVNFEFSSPTGTQPTDPTVLIDWGDGAPVETYNTITFGSPGYSRQYDDTGDYVISIQMGNSFSQRNYTHLVKVVEKLEIASIESEFPKAPLNLPFTFYFVMYRGDRLDRTTLTWDLGDGSSTFTTQRQGQGKNGKDSMSVTYTTPGTKTVTVRADAPLLQTLTATANFDIMQGVDPAAVEFSATVAVQLGQATHFTVKYTSSPVPDAAIISIDTDGDGDTDVTAPVTAITSAGDSQTLTYTYPTDGVRSPVVILHNDASSVSSTLTVGVYQSFSGVTAQLNFEHNSPPSRPYDKNGLNNLGVKYPMDEPVKFYVTDANNAYASLYTVTTVSGPDTVSTTSPTNNFELGFSVSGTYTLDIKAENPLFSGTYQKTIEIQKRMIGLQVNLSNEITIPGEAVFFEVTLKDFTSDTCVYVHWDDLGAENVYHETGATCNNPEFTGANYGGTIVDLTSSPKMYRYLRADYYTVRMVAEDSYGNTETANTSFPVSYEDCSRPTIYIQDARRFFYHARAYRKSTYIRIRGIANINCPANLANTKSWSLISVEEDTGADGPAVDISGLTTNKAELYIPTRFLPIGIFKATYVMNMVADARTPFLGEAYTYIQVIASDLIGGMVEGGMNQITMGTAQSYVLEPLEYSLDPDVEPADPQGLSIVSWDCDLVDSSSIVDAACLAIRTSTASTLTVQGSQLTEGETYVITVNLQKDTRTATAKLQILIQGLTSPVSSILCVPGSVCYRKSDGYTALESSRISLRCKCDTCMDSAQYRWTISIHDYRWTDEWRPLKDTDMMKDRSIRLNSQDLALESDLFEQFGINSDVFNARCDISNGGSNSSLTSNVWLNKPPQGGNCSIEPLVATATPSAQHQWRVVCAGWADSDNVVEFHIFSKFDETEVPKEIDSFPVMGTEHVALNETLILPVGPSYRDYHQDLWLTVRDSLNTATHVQLGTVQVLPPDFTNLDVFVGEILEDPTAEFFIDLEVGDQRSVAEKSSGFASMLTHMALQEREDYKACEIPGNKITTGYGEYDKDRPTPFVEREGECDTDTQFEADRKRNDRTKLRGRLVEAAEKLSYEDAYSIQNVAGALSQVMADPTEVANDTQIRVMDMLDMMMDSLSDQTKMLYAPQEDLEKVINSVFSALGGVQAASGIVGDYPSLEGLAAAQLAPEWKEYDASPLAPDTEPGVTNAKSYEEAMKYHSKYIYRNLNRETAKEMVLRTQAVNRELVKLFSSFAIPGQTLETASYRDRGQLRKDFVESFLGQTFQLSSSSAAVDIPSDLSHLFPEHQSITNDSVVTLQIQENTNFADVYSDYATSRLKGYSHFVTVDFVDDGGEAIPVKETVSPIKVTIPHDSKAPQPEDKLVQEPMVTAWNRFMVHQTSVEASGSSIHVQFQLSSNVQLLVVARHGEVPTPEGDKIDKVFLVPPVLPTQPEDINPYTIVLTAEDIGDNVGDWYLGVRERNSSHINMPAPTTQQIDERYPTGQYLFQHDYSIKMWVTGCYFYDMEISDWSNDGCEASQESTPEKTSCLCNHLTTFASGFVVAPNTIDWNYVFSNADFLSNPTLYITEILIFIVFATGFFLARRKDKRDIQQLGLAPLLDNRREDKYYYEIQVSTGMRRGAGTDSNVYFILSGEEDETEVRLFSDSRRPIFKKGMTNGFMMAVPSDLGRINYMRVWHDNSGTGPFASWYLNYIAVRDLQTNARQIFIADRWLALEEDDGQIDRIIPLAGKEQLEDFSYQFSERSKKDFVDGHLWFSVIARPPGSRFTCVQRVACCLCLLFMTMLTNAMFYNTQGSTSTSSTTSFGFGPFSLSSSQLFIGFVSTLIVFPVNFLLVFLFRKSRPRTGSSPAATLTFRRKEGHSAGSATSVKPGLPQLHAESSSVKAEYGNSLTSKRKCNETSTFPSDKGQDESAASSPDQRANQTSEKKSGCQLPWWCVILAWMLLVICTLGSAALVTFYGITFKDDQCKKWITSLIFSFFTSVFITQPVKVILTALFLSLIFKDAGAGDSEEEELQDWDQHSDYLHPRMSLTAAEMKRPTKPDFQPPSPEQLERVRLERLKEVQMWSVIREILFYCIFIVVLLILCHRNRGPDNFWYKDTMYRTFIKSTDTSVNFENIQNTDDFWNWAKTGLLNGLIAGQYYNAYPPLRLRTYINDKTSRMLGYAILRQLRIWPDLCQVPSHFEDYISECNEAYTQSGQEHRSFGVSWEALESSETTNRTEYTWTDGDELNSYPYWGRLGVYSGGGYVVPLNGSKDAVFERLNQLESEKWIDRYTRAVFVEFSVYNPQVNLFSVNMLVAEFHTTNGIIPSYRFEPAMLLPYTGGAMVMQVILEICFLLFIAWFILKEAFLLYRQRKSYLTDFWSWVEIAIIAFSIAATVGYFYKLYEVNKITKVIKESDGYAYVKLQFVGYWNEIFSYMLGFIVFLATLKFLKLLRFNRRVSMLANTLKYSGKHLLHFSFIFLIVFLAFCQLFWLTFMTVDETYSSFIQAMVASILMMMGKFSIYKLIEARPILTQIFVLLYLVTLTFIIVNMFVSILNDTFSEVRSDANKQSNEFEILEFMKLRFMTWTGIQDPRSNTLDGRTPKGVEQFLDHESKRQKGDGSLAVPQTCLDPADPHMAVFPSRIDQLLNSLSSIYMQDQAEANTTTLGIWHKQPYQAPDQEQDRSKSVLKKRIPNIRRSSLAKIDN